MDRHYIFYIYIFPRVKWHSSKNGGLFVYTLHRPKNYQSRCVKWLQNDCISLPLTLPPHTHTHCKLLPFSSQENHLPLCMSAIRSSFVSLIIVPFFPFWICDPSFLSVLARRFFTDLLASLVTWGEWAMINCFVSLDLRDIIIQALAAFVCYPDSLEAVENMSETLWVTFWSFFRKRNLLAPPYC